MLAYTGQKELHKWRPWAAKSLPSWKGKKPLEEANGHFSFSPPSEEVFSLSRRKGREAEWGALSRATRLAGQRSESAFLGCRW